MTFPVKRALIAALLTATALPAAAQSLPRGFYLRGTVQAEYLFDAHPDRNFFSGDLAMGILPEEAPWSLPIGVDIGLKGFRSNRGDLSESVLYGAVGFWTEMGTFWAGAPRPATSGYFTLPRIGGSQAFGAFAGTAVTSTDTIALFGESAGTVGLRYDYAVDDVKVALSYHDFTDSSVDTFAGLVAYDNGPFVVAVGAEHVSAPGVNDTDFSARLVYDVEDWGFSLLWSSTSLVESKTFAADAFYAVRPDVRLTASYARFDVEEKSRVYGVAAEYIFPNNAFVGVGVTESDLPELDAGYNAFLGFKLDY